MVYMWSTSGCGEIPWDLFTGVWTRPCGHGFRVLRICKDVLVCAWQHLAPSPSRRQQRLPVPGQASRSAATLRVAELLASINEFARRFRLVLQIKVVGSEFLVDGPASTMWKMIVINW